MLTKTVKLNANEYTNFKNDFYNNDLIILSGARGSGKSYPCAKYVSKVLLDDSNNKFIYMRLRNDELATFAGWCQDLDLATLSGSENFKLERGKPTKGDLVLYGYDNDGKKISERIIGKCMSLENSANFKSGKYDDFKIVVFEEYARLNMNPKNEEVYTFNFLEAVNSIFRNRPKKIFLICNNLKSIPLLDRTVDELTGEIFVNPIKIKIFRKNNGENRNKFLNYLNGELYEIDDFKFKVEESTILFCNKKFIIRKHMVYNNKYYIQLNKRKLVINHTREDYFNLKSFCNNRSNNEFYYAKKGLEHVFIPEYNNILAEISQIISLQGWRHIL